VGLLLGIKRPTDKISLTIGRRLYKVQHQNYKARFEVVKPDPKMGQCQKKINYMFTRKFRADLYKG
jgi:hypothetical protein